MTKNKTTNAQEQFELRQALIEQNKEASQRNNQNGMLGCAVFIIPVLIWILTRSFIVGVVTLLVLDIPYLIYYFGSKKTITPQRTIIEEYKRTCQECGKEWKSETLHEQQLELVAQDNLQRQKAAGLGMVASGYGSNTAAASASSHAYLEALNSLKALRKCPSCGSTNFKQEFYYYEVK